MTQTLERTSPLPTVERTAGPMSLEEIVDRSLTNVDKMDDTEKDRKLESLILCGNRIELLNYVKDGQLDQVVQEVPIIADLCEKIQSTADSLLEDVTLGSDTRTVIANLGKASDLVGSPLLLKRTLDAIPDKSDVNVEGLVKALTVAYNDGRLFSDVYGRIKAGKKVFENTNVFIPMADRPEFPADHPYAHLSTPLGSDGTPYRPKHRAEVPVDSKGQHITTEEAFHGIEKDPKTGLYGDGYSD